MSGTSKVEWMHIFADQESSELSVSQYCKLHGISDKAFYNAKSRYKRATEEPSLVAIEVNDDIGSSIPDAFIHCMFYGLVQRHV